MFMLSPIQMQKSFGAVTLSSFVFQPMSNNSHDRTMMQHQPRQAASYTDLASTSATCPIPFGSKKLTRHFANYAPKDLDLKSR